MRRREHHGAFGRGATCVCTVARRRLFSLLTTFRLPRCAASTPNPQILFIAQTPPGSYLVGSLLYLFA
jgi:hypothetical protein